MAKVLRIHHVGIAVDDTKAANAFWGEGLGLEISHVEDVASQKSLVTFLPIGESEIELVEPTTADSSVARFLNDRGPGIHHICMQVDDIQEMLKTLRTKGIRLINESPIEAKGRLMAFVHPKSASGVLVELYQVL